MIELEITLRVLLGSAILTTAPDLLCQDTQPAKPPRAEKPQLHLHDARLICNSKKEAEPVLMWLRAVAGESVAPRVHKPGYILVRVTRQQSEEVSDLFDWLYAYRPLQFDVEIQELRGSPKDLTALRRTAGPVLTSFEAHTALLVRANKLPKVGLKSHPPRTLTGIARAAIDKTDAKSRKTEPGLRIGALPYKDGTFRVRTWGPDSTLTTIRKDQTLVVPDEKHGRLLLVRFTNMKATRRADPHDPPKDGE